jgi:hypothetical protein
MGQGALAQPLSPKLDWGGRGSEPVRNSPKQGASARRQRPQDRRPTGASWRRRPTNVLASVLKPCVAEGDGLCEGELHGLAVRAEDGRRRGRRQTGGCVRRRQWRLRVGETGRRMRVGRQMSA